MSEHEFFGIYIKGLNPYASLPSCNTVKSDVNGLYEEEKAKVYNLLDSLDSKVSLTIDMWTSDHSVVQDGISAIRGYLVNIRKTAKYLDRHLIAKQSFDRVKQQARLQDLRDVAMDVPTRWNSTFELLETAQLGAEVVESLVTLKDWIPPINKISRQSRPIIGEEVRENESE